VPPPSSVADVADDGLPASVHMDMLHPYALFALASFSRQGFDLHGVRAHKFVCQVAEHVEPFDAVTLVRVACDSLTGTGNQFEQRNNQLIGESLLLRRLASAAAGSRSSQTSRLPGFFVLIAPSCLNADCAQRRNGVRPPRLMPSWPAFGVKPCMRPRLSPERQDDGSERLRPTTTCASSWR
jgi:hypothetical protein